MCAVHGQKGFNGVALLSKRPIEDVTRGLPGGDGDEQARFIAGLVAGDDGGVRVACAYMPNGNPLGIEKFAYKLAWMERLRGWTKRRARRRGAARPCRRLQHHPDPIDAKNPEAWTGDALFQPETRGAFRRLQALGLTDAVRAVDDSAGIYTFWDYQAGAWQKNNGIRIDHVLLSPEAADRLVRAGHRPPRARLGQAVGPCAGLGRASVERTPTGDRFCAGVLCWSFIMKTILIALASVLVVGGAEAWADPNCTCRAAGVEAELGQTVCLKTPSGFQLARCEMVLNNTSWKFLGDSCPQASRAATNLFAAALSPAPATPLSLR